MDKMDNKMDKNNNKSNNAKNNNNNKVEFGSEMDMDAKNKKNEADCK